MKRGIEKRQAKVGYEWCELKGSRTGILRILPVKTAKMDL